ncbi:MAG: hypothetical protein D6805_09080 [Planctomycetota bacterium]|nr:MAG: hypothetical protein D6805_09080 [Planctomycetota bacterium]
MVFKVGLVSESSVCLAEPDTCQEQKSLGVLELYGFALWVALVEFWRKFFLNFFTFGLLQSFSPLLAN